MIPPVNLYDKSVGPPHVTWSTDDSTVKRGKPWVGTIEELKTPAWKEAIGN